MSELKEIHAELKRIEDTMATKKDIDDIKTTLEVMSNPETIKQLAESLKDIKAGRVKTITSVHDLLSEL